MEIPGGGTAPKHFLSYIFPHKMFALNIISPSMHFLNVGIRTTSPVLL